MAHYIFAVNVRTDPKHLDAPSAIDIRNEILSTLEFDAHAIGIDRVTVREVQTIGGFTDACREETPIALLTDMRLKSAAIDTLRLLDDIATSPYMMGAEDIERLCIARAALGLVLGVAWNRKSNRYTEETNA